MLAAVVFSSNLLSSTTLIVPCVVAGTLTLCPLAVACLTVHVFGWAAS